MDSAGLSALRVALLADDEYRGGFRAWLEREGVDVVFEVPHGLPLPRAWNDAEVLLVTIKGELSGAHLGSLLAQSPLPVVFNQGALGRTDVWSRTLMAKLEGLARGGSQDTRRVGARIRPDLRVVPPALAVEQPAMQVVVLGASLGGPEAVARFLRELSGEMPLVFLLAQHISERFQGLLAEQLDKCGTWRVAVLAAQQQLERGQVWLLPAQTRVVIDSSGVLRCCAEPWGSIQKPDINAVLCGAANAFGARCGAIMFSGLAGDGAHGCEMVTRRGGFVWAQTTESCAVASLPAAACRSGSVEFSGTPEQLAHELASRCQVQSTSVN